MGELDRETSLTRPADIAWNYFIQLIDANMVEGAAYLGSWVFKTQDTPIFGNPRGENLLDTGAHNYDTFRTKDGMFMAVGSLEPQFYAAMLQGLGIAEEDDLPVDMEDRGGGGGLDRE